ncbi:MAG: MAPEG family protein [Rickettsiales bacterium]|nr:MAPEG family protein [Rickettsiales bacterium]
MTTSLYAALVALMFIALSVNVIRGRRKNKIALGDNGNHDMQRRMRAQGNFAEYAPIFLILLVLAEYNGLPTYGVHGLGVLFLLGRISHAYGILKAEQHRNGQIPSGLGYRIRGMVCTFTTLGILVSILLTQYAINLFSSSGDDL